MTTLIAIGAGIAVLTGIEQEWNRDGNVQGSGCNRKDSRRLRGRKPHCCLGVRWLRQPPSTGL